MMRRRDLRRENRRVGAIPIGVTMALTVGSVSYVMLRH